jgi:Chaperonin 10 Kd subunit.
MEKINIEEVIPLRDNILIKMEVEANKSGIILSEEAKENSKHTLRAVKVGPNCQQVAAGDELLVNTLEFMGTKLRLDEEHVIASEAVVVAVKRPK